MFTLRECVEKLQILKTPEERQRRLEEIPEIHVDPNMDPSYESEDEGEDDKRQGPFFLVKFFHVLSYISYLIFSLIIFWFIQITL